MKIITISLFFLLLPVAAFAGQLGININFAERGGTFIDLVKEGYRWSTPSGSDLSATQVDSLGWPTVDARFVVDYRPVAEWSNTIDDPEAYRIDASGTYPCAFTGNATVRGVSGGTVQNISYDSTNNTTTFNFLVSGPPGNNHGLFIIEFTKSKRTAASQEGSGITSFRMLRPGYPLNSQKVFTDQFIAALIGIKFSSIRFMNFSMTNGSDPEYPARTTWEKRKLRQHASQDRIAPLGKKDGGAWEHIIDLCNLVKTDPWINIPVSADSQYIVNLAKLFKDNLDQNLHIYVESSNEVWNTAPGFEQSLYNQAEAKALGIGEHENHARRTIQIARIFSQIYGDRSLNTRVRVILCSHQPMLKWWVIPMLTYISKNFGSPKNYLYAIACQTYFGGGTAAGVSVDQILSNCHDNIYNQIDERGKTNEAGRVQWIELAKDSGFSGGFCSYEGGPDHGGGSTDNIANRISAERDPRMGKLWTYNCDTAFFKLGGNLAMQFTLSSAYTRYGCWGLTDDITNVYRNSKYKAAQDLAMLYSNPVLSYRRKNDIYKGLNVAASKVNTTINISYHLKEQSNVCITVWNIMGKRMLQQRLPGQPAGYHVVHFNTTGNGTMSNTYLIAAVTTEKMTERCGMVMMQQ